jgi:hypothetical protein
MSLQASQKKQTGSTSLSLVIAGSKARKCKAM